MTENGHEHAVDYDHECNISNLVDATHSRGCEMTTRVNGSAFELLRSCDAHVHHRKIETATLECDLYAIDIGERHVDDDAGHDILWVLIWDMRSSEEWVYRVPGHGDPNQTVPAIMDDAVVAYLAAHPGKNGALRLSGG